MAVFHALPGPEGKQEAFNHSFGSSCACSASISLRATSYLECYFGGFSAFLSTAEKQKSLYVLESLSTHSHDKRPQRLIHTSLGLLIGHVCCFSSISVSLKFLFSETMRPHHTDLQCWLHALPKIIPALAEESIYSTNWTQTSADTTTGIYNRRHFTSG